MSSGWNQEVGFPPMKRDYIAFSIEELSTIDLNDVDTIER